LFKYRSKTTRR